MTTKLNEVMENLEQALNAAKEELTQFQNGKKAAAPRLRKVAQECKNLWQDLRIEVMEQLKQMPTKKRGE